MGVRLHRGLTRCLALAALAACAACGGGGDGGNPPPTSQLDATVTAVVAADSTALASIDPNVATDDDLAAFGTAVGERRIVLLTEATHGDGATFRLKARLVRYLHERKGFDVLFVESGLYDTVRIQQRLAAGGDSISVQAPGRVFYMYSRTDDGQLVLKYADATRATATPLELWGHDVPMGGADSTQSLLANLQAFLVARGSPSPQSADWPGFLRVATPSVALRTQVFASADTASFLAMSAQLTTELCGQADVPGDLLQSPAFWCRMVQGIHADYTHLWSATDPRTPTDLRDTVAGGNLQWLLDGRLAGRKAIVWLHAIHGIDGWPGFGDCALAASQECGPGFVNVGTALVRAYGDQVWIAAITAGGGAYDTYDPTSACGAPGFGSLLDLPGPSGLESYLAIGGQPRFLPWPADAAGRQALAPLSVHEDEFRLHRPSDFGRGYQGLFFLPSLAATRTDCAAYPVVAYP
jgi:erythromycin esterase-like protein